jgi:hypothetical protein
VGKRWREIGSRLIHYGRRALPVVVSAGLITWLIHTTGLRALGHAFTTEAWPELLTAAIVQLLVLFLWDTICLWWLFSQPGIWLPFRTVLRARTDAMVWSAVNLEIGQAAFAYNLAKRLDIPVTQTLGRCLLLAIFDFGTLQGLALFGSFLHYDPLIDQLRWICIISLPGLALLYLLLRLMPRRWRRWLEGRYWANWLRWWTWGRGVVLWGLRLIMFLLVLVYVGISLAICRLPVNPPLVLGVVPFVLMAESLPGTAGLGERETALIYLLHAEGHQRAVLLSFGLIWSSVILVGRLAIGLTSLWLPRKESPREQGRLRGTALRSRGYTAGEPSRR